MDPQDTPGFTGLPRDKREAYFSAVLTANELACAGHVTRAAELLQEALADARAAAADGIEWGTTLALCYSRVLCGFAYRTIPA